MNPPILPEKHVRTGESIIGIGAVVLDSLAQEPGTLDSLWADMKNADALRYRIHGTVTFDSLVLTIDVLYAIGAVTLDDKGLLNHASN